MEQDEPRPSSQNDPAIDEENRDRAQPLPVARTGNAFSILDTEQRPMCSAEEVLAIRRNETVRHPVQRRALMRTGVDEGAQRRALTVDNDVVLSPL